MTRIVHPNLVIVIALALSAVLALNAIADSEFYVKKDSWAQTMMASRKALSEADALQSFTAGPWFTTGAFPLSKFDAQAFPERDVVDIKKKDKNGTSRWTIQKNWADNVVHNLPGSDKQVTYLYREIEAKQAMELDVILGSDDALVVWLNDKRVLKKDVKRVAGPSDKVTLQLQQGTNRFLMKIYNYVGGHGFYFGAADKTIDEVWANITRDFPKESSWMQAYAADNHLNWFRFPDATEYSININHAVLGKLGEDKKLIEGNLDQLRNGNANADDARWLECFITACSLKEARDVMATINLEALRRAVNDLASTYPDVYDGPTLLNAIDQKEDAIATAKADVAKGNVSVDTLIALANETRALQRDILFTNNPLIDFDQLLLVRRSERNLGLPQNWLGNCGIASAGYDNEIVLMDMKNPEGKPTTLFRPEDGKFVGDVDLHFDADKMIFSMPGSQNRWQIFELGADGSGLRQVNPGEYEHVDNYDPCYLPDGRIIFGSTRPFHGIPCISGSRNAANLFIMDSDGSNQRRLGFDQDHNWCPTVLNNGRVMYTRWEYADTAHYFTRILFHMNPDGTNQMEYYGSSSYWPNSLFYAKAVPGHPTKVAAIVTGHHGVPRQGELVILDPAEGRFEANGAIQQIPGYGKKVEPKIIDQLVDNSWPRFLHPHPLNEKYLLVSCKPTPSEPWGLYLVDVFDNMLLLRQETGYAMLEPVPFRKTSPPPVVPDKVDLDDKEATIYMADIYEGPGLRGVPRGTAKTLRLFEVHYSYSNMGGHRHIGVEGPWDVHRILGTVPILEDGSSIFKVPANTPIAVQPLDDKGGALQLMRSWFTAMPGENLSCVGCHEQQNSSVPSAKTMASQMKPMTIKPWYGPARGFSFKRDVQPVLDQFCVGCHAGKEGRPDFRRTKENGWENFTPSYLALHPYVRRPGPESDYHIPEPMEWHPSTSELIQMLEKGHHGVQLTAEAWDRLYTWIDLNVPDHGTWKEHKEIPHDWDKKRAEMQLKYAFITDDPEAIPEGIGEERAFEPPQQRTPTVNPQFNLEHWPFSEQEAQQLQEQALGTVNASTNGKTKTLTLANGITMDFVLIPAGEYIMGDAKGAPDEQPLSRVKIEEPFWMGVTEVSNAQYAAFDPHHDTGVIDQHHKDHTRPGYVANAPLQPAARLSWNEAMAFCAWMSNETGIQATLPTEAQWEWACRAGSSEPFSYGDNSVDFANFANLADATVSEFAVNGVDPKPVPNPGPHHAFVPRDNRFDDGHMIVSDIGSFAPNAWGLKDMHGNVAEWTLSTYLPYPYEGTERDHPATPGKKVARGGSWRDRPFRATASYRYYYLPYQRVFNVGFRVILPVSKKETIAIAKAN